MTFGQCFIPPLTPTAKEANFDQKSLRNREKTFSRFLRGIVKSPEIASSSLVLQFLKIDHFAADPKNGLKEFSK